MPGTTKYSSTIPRHYHLLPGFYWKKVGTTRDHKYIWKLTRMQG